jgi:RNA 2',3'-cyclic 3'-phosphodiesterase
MKTFRAFLAVPIGDDLVRAAADFSGRLRRQLRERGGAKWVLPQNLHITLRFLGNVGEEQVPAICETLGPIVRRHSSFLARLGALGAFPNPSHPSVLWVGLRDGAEPLAQLATDVGRAMADLGFPEEDREFHGHVTLARFRQGVQPDVSDVVAEHAGLDLGSAVVREVLLFESTLRSRGPVYHPVWRGALHPGGAPSRGPAGPGPMPETPTP